MVLKLKCTGGAIPQATGKVIICSTLNCHTGNAVTWTKLNWSIIIILAFCTSYMFRICTRSLKLILIDIFPLLNKALRSVLNLIYKTKTFVICTFHLFINFIDKTKNTPNWSEFSKRWQENLIYRTLSHKKHVLNGTNTCYRANSLVGSKEWTNAWLAKLLISWEMLDYATRSIQSITTTQGAALYNQSLYFFFF